jgi:hypothetical protein
MRRPEDPVTRLLDVAREPERRLAAELRHDADRLLPIAHCEHFLGRQWLEVQPVGRVVVRRHRLGVAVDHHGLVAERSEGLRRVDAAVVELDALPDAIWAGAEDHDPWLVARRCGLVLLAPGRVEVVRGSIHLAGTGVDAPECGPNALLVAESAYVEPGHAQIRSDGVVAPAGPLRARDVARLELCPRERDLLTEPGMQVGRKVLVVEALPRRRRAGLELARAVSLQERLAERPADAHRLAH